MISDELTPALLRTFTSVCLNESLTKAAQQTGRAQSAISIQIRRLEEIAGTRLLHRTGRGVIPTPSGELLLSYANRILALNEEIMARFTTETLTGTVRVGLAEDVANSTLPAALGRLKRTCPQLHLEVLIDHGENIGRRWHDHDLDIALVESLFVKEDPLQSWINDMYWVSAIDCEPNPKDMLELVVFAEPCDWRRRMLEVITEAGSDFRVAFTCHNFASITTAVESGIGISLLPPHAINTKSMRILNFPKYRPLTVRYGLYARKIHNAGTMTALNLIRDSLTGREMHSKVITNKIDRKNDL